MSQVLDASSWLFDGEHLRRKTSHRRDVPPHINGERYKAVNSLCRFVDSSTVVTTLDDGGRFQFVPTQLPILYLALVVYP